MKQAVGISRIAMGGVVALLFLALASTPAAADCSRAAPPSDLAAYRGITFVATIADITRQQDKYQRWVVTFRVEHVYHGTVSDTVVVRDVGGSCGELRPDMMHSGQRVVVTANRLQSSVASSFDHVLIWREDAPGHWRFYQDALTFGYAGDYYPVAARKAKTIETILFLSNPGAMPDTAVLNSTQSVNGQGSPGDNSLPLVGMAAGGASLAWVARRRRSVAPIP
jgi:hypothetical protein